MRLASLAVVATLLLAVGPTVAEHKPGGEYLDESDSFEDWIEIDQDAYAKAGWWDGNPNVPADGGYNVSLDGTDTSAEEEPERQWLWITDDSTSGQATTVRVTAQGPVVAAMDVFKVTDNNDITPDCPQYFVEDLYPNEDENRLSWLFRVNHQTTGFHQRTLSGTMSVDLYPSQSDRGYMVAIYPQAGSGNDLVNTGYQIATDGDEANITYNVSAGSDDTRLFTDQNWKSPEDPFHLERWVGGVGTIQDCADRGLELPPSLQDQAPLELPATQPVEDQVASMLETSIGDDQTT